MGKVPAMISKIYYVCPQGYQERTLNLYTKFDTISQYVD